MIITRLISLPYRICGYTAMDPDGNYNIYINERLNREQQLKTYNHELTHIVRNDWDEKKSVAEAESGLI